LDPKTSLPQKKPCKHTLLEIEARFPSIERGGDASFFHTGKHFHLGMEIFRPEFPCIDEI
jgi:hypothetical protein